jgi:hypothetical protein
MFTGMRALLMCLVAFGLFVSTPALAGDVDDLKSTYEKAVKAYNSRDDAWFTMFDNNAVSFHPTAPFAIDGDAQNQQTKGRRNENQLRAIHDHLCEVGREVVSRVFPLLGDPVGQLNRK